MPSCPFLPTPHPPPLSPVLWELGKPIQRPGAGQCGHAVKSYYSWIFLPPYPTKATQLSVERCFPRNTTQHRVGLWHVINTEQPSVPLGQLSWAASGIQVEKGIIRQIQ